MFGVWLGRPRVPSGAWPHVPGVCQLLDDKDTDAIKWPPIPPDLNLIEHFLYRPPWLTTDDSGADWRPNPGVKVHPYPIRSMLWWCSNYIQTQWGHMQYWATSGVALREFTEVGEQPGCQPASFGFRCSLLNYFLQDRESLIFVWFSPSVHRSQCILLPKNNGGVASSHLLSCASIASTSCALD